MRHAHAHMYGLTGRPDRYEQIARRPGRGLYGRIVADVAAADLPPGARILDVGTGPGTVPLALAAALPQVTLDGLDLAPTMVEHAAAAARAAGLTERVRFVAADGGDMPFPDDAFDLVVSSLSLHHWADAPAVVGEIGRVLRPGGVAWIYDVRPILGRAERAARRRWPAAAVHRAPVRTGRLPVRLFGRCTIRRPE
ncbi:class I SAM-dependent methyltransferase [Plantactinospora siamensis]|uniref:Class I SAM-dependent methyltransferase n=1 Tax=Plantactinospora siamensis TaxID=555372 RepID=A0ABV6P2U6_9ACTN